MRAMVPFLVQLADHFLSDADAMEIALKLCCRSLHQCYLSLDERSFLHADAARAQSIAFAPVWVALHLYWTATDDQVLKLKPKLHLFLHIIPMGRGHGGIGPIAMRTMVVRLLGEADAAGVCYP